MGIVNFLEAFTVAKYTTFLTDSYLEIYLIKFHQMSRLILSIQMTYDTKYCRKVISARQAHAVIPPRKNAQPWKDKTLRSMQRNELLKTVKRLGRAIWKN